MHYVIGDVHGCYKELKLILNKIDNKDPDAIIYFVGDWIDRGPQTADVMQWVVDNITTRGKYRSVRGNHDQEALDWYRKEFIPWSRRKHDSSEILPETTYDFSTVVDNSFNRDPDLLKPFFKKVIKAMPFNATVETTTIGNVNMTYRICHASYSNKKRTNLNQINLYERNYWGYNFDNEIVVHGHTPTISQDYRLRGKADEELPGMIGYRPCDINVDGGCCFFENYPGLACMLCGICLETLEEFYPYSLEERIMEGAKLLVKDYYLPLPEALSEDEKLQMIYKLNMERYLTKKANEYREMLLEMIGLKN